MAGYLDTANELTKGLNSLFSNLTLGRFLKWVFVILLLSAIALLFYEKAISSSFYYGKLERKLEIIEKVKSIDSSDSLVRVTINQKLLETLNELNPPQSNYLESINLALGFSFQSIWIVLLKLLGAVILPILIIFSARGDSNKKDTITGSIIFIIIFGVISLFIPVIYSIWVNVLGMPLLQILVLLPFMWRNKK